MPLAFSSEAKRPPHAGRGGWSWYTGSAGWLYRAATEGILGIRRQGDRLFVNPVLPSDWNGFTAELTVGDTAHRIVVEGDTVTIDGQVVNEAEGFLLDGEAVKRLPEPASS